MTDDDIRPPGAALIQQLKEGVADVDAAVTKLWSVLPQLNEGVLRGRVEAFVHASERVMEQYGSDPGPDIVDKLVELLDGIRALDVPARDELLGPIPALEQLEIATGLIAIRLIKALDMAEANRWVSRRSPLPKRDTANIPKQDLDRKLAGIEGRLNAVVAAINELTVGKEDVPSFPQQAGLVSFFAEAVQTEVDLARMHLRVGQSVTDFSALADIGETIAELTGDFLATIRAWAGLVSRSVLRAAETVRKTIRNVLVEIRQVIRWFAQTVKRGKEEQSKRDANSSLEPPKDFDLVKVVTMIRSGRQPPEEWRPFIVSLNMPSDQDIGNNLADLSPLSALSNLEHLDIRHASITDLSHLSALTQLRSLNLSGTRVRNLTPLANLARLESLSVQDTPVTNIASLAKLAGLSILDLEFTAVEDITSLSKLVELRSLNLRGTWVTKIDALANLRHLEVLDLQGTPVRDISPLGALAELRSLNIEGTQVASISALAESHNLRVLIVGATSVRDLDGLANLRRLSIVRWTPEEGERAALVAEAIRRRRTSE